TGAILSGVLIPATVFFLAEIALERPRAAHVPQARERLFLDLADALARDVQHGADLLERHRLGPVESEIEAQDLRLALLEPRQGELDRFRERLVEGLLVRRLIRGIGEIVEEPV